MFRKTCKLIETHSESTKSVHSHTRKGTCDAKLPKLIAFSFRELPLPKNYQYPLEGYASTTLNKSFTTKLYLPDHIFLIHFEFDCKEQKSNALPELKDEYLRSEENVEK